MKISLKKALAEDAHALHEIQIKSFLPLLEKYKDYETSPASELLDKTLDRINDPLKEFYKILKEDVLVGGIVLTHEAPGILLLGPLFIDPCFQNQKIGQRVLELVEMLFPKTDIIELKTLAQEKGNVYLYEKMGYVVTGEQKKINDSLDLIFFRKKMMSPTEPAKRAIEDSKPERKVTSKD